MSFLVDPALLYAEGQAYARLAPGEPSSTPTRVWAAATLGLFYVVSGALYLNQGWVRRLWEACRAEDGRDWMLNSGVFRFDHRNAGPRTHVLAVLLFATYPLWLMLGYRHGLRARAEQG